MSNKEGDLTDQNNRPSNWNGLVPESNGEATYKIFCKNEETYQSIKDWLRKADLIEQGTKLIKSKDYVY